LIKDLIIYFTVMHLKSSLYYSRINRHTKSTNKVLIQALTKFCDMKRKHYANIPHVVLWECRTRWEKLT